MATPKELRANITDARASFLEALHEAHDKWETKPQGTADGEAAWSPKEVAGHVAGAEWFFTNSISVACGAPEVARPSFEASTPAKTAGTITRNAAKFDDIIRHVSEGDLAKPVGEKFPIPNASVGDALNGWASHLNDHASQIRTACS
jgi:hypothetical protein